MKKYLKKLKKISIIGITLSMLFATGAGITSNSALASHKDHSWRWEKALSAKRANYNVDHNDLKNYQVRHRNNLTTRLYKQLRHHYNSKQSIVILALAKHESSLKNLKPYQPKGYLLPIYGYFNFIGASEKPLLKYANHNHLNPNKIYTQFQFLSYCSNQHGFNAPNVKGKNLSTTELAQRVGKDVFLDAPFNSNASANKYIHSVVKSLE